MSTAEGYAKAILDVAIAEDVLLDVEEELFRFKRTLEANPALLEGLADTALPPERRKAMIEELLAGKLIDQTVQLISFVVGSGKGRLLPDIIDAFLGDAAASRNSAVAEVRSAVALNEDQKARLAAALNKATGKSVELRTIVDPAVVGGVYAKVGDYVIDGTLKTRLDRIRDQITTTQ